MKSLTIALAAVLLAGLVPVALAVDGTCNETPKTSYIEHPLDEGRYLYIDVTSPNNIEKLGEWVEDNGVPGLQTEMCVRSGIIRFVEDLQAPLLP